MTPYRDSREHLLDEIRRVDLLLRLHVETWRERGVGVADDIGGLYVSDEQVDGLLRESHGHMHVTEDSALRARLENHAREIRRRREQALDAGTTLRLVELAADFDLSPRHVDALLLCLAPALDAKYEQVFGYLHDDLTQDRPTVGLLLDVLSTTDTLRLDARSLFEGSSPLVAHELVRFAHDDVPLPSRVVAVDERIVTYLLERDDLDPTLAGIAEVTTPTATLADVPVADATRDRLDALALTPEDTPTLAVVSGPAGVGKRLAVDALCRKTGGPVLRANLAAVSSSEVSLVLDRLVREGRLRDAALHVLGVDSDNGRLGESLSDESDSSGSSSPAAPNAPDRPGRSLASLASRDVAAVAQTLDGFLGHVFLSPTERWTPRKPVENHAVATVHLPMPTYSLRLRLWREWGDALPVDVDRDALAATFRLTPGQIDDVLATMTALARDGTPTAETVYEACRAQSSDRLAALAKKVTPHYGWDDIVLPPETARQLREVAAHVTHRGTVYGDWGFEDRFSLGTGLVVLFTGPTGTGKTMAAEVLAGDVGLDLYKVDLASVVSKYVGETEKNLGRIFDEAANSDAILFFDEADALFGKRTDVTDSHDRYANIEVNYLLQRVEEHDGTVVLTTNLERNIDDAFLRRIHLSVDFPLPDAESRRHIWEGMFPTETPLGDVDFGFLSTVAFAGGNIKNVTVTAAFLAAAEDRAVEMRDVVRATKREFQKTGTLVDPNEFGEYRDLLEE